MVINGKEYQLPKTQEEALAILNAFNQERAKLSREREEELIKKHRKDTLKGFKYDLTDPNEYKIHCDLVFQIANNLMLREYSKYEIDEYNERVLRFLLYYFNDCILAEQVFPNENYKLNKNIMLIGEPGTGKTMMMQIFSDYLRITQNEHFFINISATQLMNYHKVHGHIDKYTFNEANSQGIDGNPLNVCLNDLGLLTENQKSFGTLLTQIIDEFLFARYEIYQQSKIDKRKHYHITSNLTVKEMKQRFEDRLVDRFKSFNVIELRGNSRRK